MELLYQSSSSQCHCKPLVVTSPLASTSTSDFTSPPTTPTRTRCHRHAPLPPSPSPTTSRHQQRLHWNRHSYTARRWKVSAALARLVLVRSFAARQQRCVPLPPATASPCSGRCPSQGTAQSRAAISRTIHLEQRPPLRQPSAVLRRFLHGPARSLIHFTRNHLSMVQAFHFLTDLLQRSYSSMSAPTHPPRSRSPGESLFVSDTESDDYERPSHYQRTNNGLALPRRHIGDGFDFRRPITGGSEASGTSGNADRNGHTVIDLTAEDDSQPMAQQPTSAPEAGPAAGSSRAQRPPRFGRNIIDVGSEDEDTDQQPPVSTTPSEGCPFQHLSRKRAGQCLWSGIFRPCDSPMREDAPFT